MLVLGACETRPREIYDIPAGYRGWVEIRTKRVDCPPLPGDRDERRLVIPRDGRLCTSSPVAFGWGRDEFYYVSDGERVRLPDAQSGSRRMIWQHEYFGSDGVGPKSETERDRIRFFVGTKAEYDHAWHGGISASHAEKR
jgi:hypothetical protein